MSISRTAILVGSCFVLAVISSAASQGCAKPGTERLPVKTSLPASAKSQVMTLTDGLKLVTISGRPSNDDNCMIVEVPSGQYATTISTGVEGVRRIGELYM